MLKNSVMKMKYMCIAMMTAGTFAVTSCSDFDDYNEIPVASRPEANQTLWTTIDNHPKLLNFKALMQKSGFDAELIKSCSYTVWAPIDGSYQVEDYQNLTQAELLKQFVKSHVAQYSHQASGKIDERIHTLNEKSFAFVGDGSYTYDGVEVTETNIPGTNGLLHFINGVATFFPNLYEYLQTVQGVDSIRNYILGYDMSELDQTKSVKGPIVNGLQTWIDSVMVTRNSFLESVNADIDCEDSTYTILLPTDKAYNSLYEKIKPTNFFMKEVTALDYEKMSSASDMSSTKKFKIEDPEYLSDSLTRHSVACNLFFNNKDIYNRWIVGNGESTDTLRNTQSKPESRKFSNPDDILNKYRVGEPEKLSNGYARVVDSLAFYPWETYNPSLWINPNDYVKDEKVKIYVGGKRPNMLVPDTMLTKVFGEDHKFDRYRYLWIDSAGEYTKSDIFIPLPEVKSTTYNFYVVFMPSAWPYFGNDSRPNLLNFQLIYDAGTNDGKLTTYNFSKAYADSLLTGGQLPIVPAKVDAKTAFENNPQVTDTVFIGRKEFPVSYGEMDGYYPFIHISSPISVFNKAQKGKYTRDVRIAAILLKPVELDEFDKEKNISK